MDVRLAFANYLWATADVLILAGVDLGWALRLLPNQLYYAFTVPFFWWRTRRRSEGVPTA